MNFMPCQLDLFDASPEPARRPSRTALYWRGKIACVVAQAPIAPRDGKNRMRLHRELPL
jgi:hypothetical protein